MWLIYKGASEILTHGFSPKATWWMMQLFLATLQIFVFQSSLIIINYLT